LTNIMKEYLKNTYFEEENRCIKEIKLFDYQDDIISFDTMIEVLNKKYSDKLRHCIISKLKKFNFIQNHFIKNLKQFKNEFNDLLSKFLESNKSRLMEWVNSFKSILNTEELNKENS